MIELLILLLTGTIINCPEGNNVIVAQDSSGYWYCKSENTGIVKLGTNVIMVNGTGDIKVNSVITYMNTTTGSTTYTGSSGQSYYVKAQLLNRQEPVKSLDIINSMLLQELTLKINKINIQTVEVICLSIIILVIFIIFKHMHKTFNKHESIGMSSS